MVKNVSSNVACPCNNLLVGSGGLVALKTARGVLRGKGEAKVVDPKGLRREFLGIDTFDQRYTKAEQREVVELEFKPANGNNVITIEAYVVPEICTVQNTHLELARKH